MQEKITHSTNYLLLDVLSSLSSKEKKAFEAYIIAPLFNKNERLICLYHQLEKNNLTIPSKENLFAYIFEKELFNELKLNNAFSDLLRLLYDFLIHQRLHKQSLLQQITLMDCLIERNIHKPIKRITKKCLTLQAQSQEKSHHHYHESLQLLEQLDRLSLLQGQRSQPEQLQQMSDMLDVYYFCNKLRIACEMASRARLANQKYEPKLIETVLAAIESQPALLLQAPALQIYHALYELLTQPSIEQYDFLKATVYQFQAVLPKNELRDVFIYLLNFSVRQINYGNSTYYKEILNICQRMMEQGILLEYNQLTKWTFINATTAGIRLKSFEWTARFIKDYQQYLKKEERENTVDYQLASLYFAKGDYNKTLRLLQQVEFTDTFYQASARIIQLKVFYELEETEPFFALTKSIKGVLRRKRNLSDYHRMSYSNFVKVVKAIYELRLLPKYQKRLKHQKVKDLLDHLQPLTNKEWLAEKYERLMERVKI